MASYTIIVMFTLSAPVAFVTAWAFAFWAAVPLLVRAIHWRQAHGRGFRGRPLRWGGKA